MTAETKKEKIIDPEIQRLQPHSEELEQIVLGAIMLDEEAFEKVVDFIEDAYFYNSNHRLIFKAIVALYDKGVAIDPLTVAEELKVMQCLDEVGGAYYLSQLTNMVSSTASVEHYTKILEKKYILRCLIQVSGQTIDQSFNTFGDPEKIIPDLLTKIENLSASRTVEIRPIEDVLQEGFDKLQERFRKEGKALVKTGFNGFDWKYGGFMPGDLIIFGARMSIGKTAFALNLCDNFSRQDYNTALFSSETHAYRLTDRMIVQKGRIDSKRLRKGELNESEWVKYAKVAEEIKKRPLTIQYFNNPTMEKLCSVAKKIHRKKPLSVLLYDWLGMDELERGDEMLHIKIGNAAKKLKKLAMDLDIPVIVFLQLNKENLKRDSKIPQIGDIRQGDNLAQVADVIAFLHREQYYKDDQSEESYDPSAIIQFRKFRDDEIGKIDLHFIQQYASFQDITHEEVPEKFIQGISDRESEQNDDELPF